MRLLRLFLLFWAVALFVSGCAGQANLTPPQADRPTVPTPAGTNSVVTGQVLGASTTTPIKKTPVYLAKIYWDSDHKNAAFALDLAQSPSTQTDENGFFTLTDVQPGEYALIVGDYYGRNEVVRESNGNAHIYEPAAGKTTDIGPIQMPMEVQAK